MTHQIGDAWDDEADEPDEAESGRGWLAYVVIVALLVGTGSGSALLWRAAGGGSLQSMLASSSAPSVSAQAGPPAEVEALREQLRQVSTLNQSSQQALAAQQAEIKRLSDQVASLSGKLDLLQRPVASAQAAIPQAKPSAPPAAKKKPETPKLSAAAKPEPKPGVDPRPTGAVSTGGAPLPSTR